MLASRERTPAGARSLAYRERFRETHGVSYPAARRIGVALGLGPGSPARALRGVTSTAAGAELLSYSGSDTRRQALSDEARKVAGFQARELGAVQAVAQGRHGEPGSKAAIADAEGRYGLPKGTLRRDFSLDELKGGTDRPFAMWVPTADAGMRLIVVEGQEQRQLLGQYWRELNRALEGKPNRLASFSGVEVGGHPLNTNLGQLRAFYDAGLLEGPYPEARS